MATLETYPHLHALMTERYSCRSYDLGRDTLDHDLIKAVIDAARLAPSACNRQPWLFMVVEGAEAREKVFLAYGRDWIKQAPAYIIALGEPEAAWHRPADGHDHTDVDLAIAVEHICLAASALGLGTCWVCNFDPAVLRREFNIPDRYVPVAIVPIGYPAPGSPATAKIRKSDEEITRWGSF